VQFWSGEANHCTIPGCLNASITVTIPMTITVQNQTGSPYPDLPVSVSSGESYTSSHGTSDGDGQVAFTLPAEAPIASEPIMTASSSGVMT
jgi:hypothetical protein